MNSMTHEATLVIRWKIPKRTSRTDLEIYYAQALEALENTVVKRHLVLISTPSRRIETIGSICEMQVRAKVFVPSGISKVQFFDSEPPGALDPLDKEIHAHAVNIWKGNHSEENKE